MAAWIRPEEIGIATEVLGGRERDRIDPVLDHRLAGGGEAGDPMRERFDEGAELVGRQRSVDPAVPVSQLRVDLRDAHETACAQIAKQEGDRRLTGELGRLK
jgi:hypothetical protein